MLPQYIDDKVLVHMFRLDILLDLHFCMTKLVNLSKVNDGNAKPKHETGQP